MMGFFNGRGKEGKEMKKFSTKAIVATGIGAALFFVLGKFVAIPSGVPNTNLALQYGVLSFFACLYGPVCGLLVGFIGHWLIDLTAGWGVWWSWVIASAVSGLLLGLLTNKIELEKGKFEKADIIKFVIANVVAYAVAWALVAPLGDILIYAEDASYVFTQGFVSFGLDTVVGIVVGGLLALAYSKTIAKPNSLDKE